MRYRLYQSSLHGRPGIEPESYGAVPYMMVASFIARRVSSRFGAQVHADQNLQPRTDKASSCRDLEGVRICLVFEHDLSHYTRIRQEMRALVDAGATVRLLTTHRVLSAAPEGVPVTVAPLDSSIVDSTMRWRPARIAHNLTRNALNAALSRVAPTWNARRRIAALRRIAPQTDLFWVIDFPSLPTVIDAAKAAGARVVYETVDLVPEYLYDGEAHRQRMLDEERRLIGQVDGFVTACEGYADYYIERYSTELRGRRPVVRTDMPATQVDQPGTTGQSVKLLFLGSLMSDRPITELIAAISLTSSYVTLTLQGNNHIGDTADRLVRQLGLTDRIRILGPCAPEDVVAAASNYDVGIVALRGLDENERRASTTKLFTYMAAGLAIIGSDLPGISRVVREHHNGVLVRDMTPADWAAAIDEVAGMGVDEIDTMRRRSLEGASRYAWDLEKPAFIGECVRALGAAHPHSPQANGTAEAIDKIISNE
ncbi:MAG: glycosyltransferase [Coriobacteriia bacterium]